MLPPSCYPSHKPPMYRLGSYPRVSQRCLEFRIGLTLRLDQRVNFFYQFGVLLFSLLGRPRVE